MLSPRLAVDQDYQPNEWLFRAWKVCQPHIGGTGLFEVTRDQNWTWDGSG